MSEKFDHVCDALHQLEARIAFINAAVEAISEAGSDMRPNRKAWEGFFYITLDILELTTQARALAEVR